MHFNGAGVCTPDGTRPPRHTGPIPGSFNGAGVCTPDGTERSTWAILNNHLQWSRSLHSGWNDASPTCAAMYERLQWSRSLHSGWNGCVRMKSACSFTFNGAGVCTPDGTMPRYFMLTGCRPSMEPEFALRMELFPQNSKGKQALQTAFSSTRTERANLPFHPARGKKKFLYSC